MTGIALGAAFLVAAAGGPPAALTVALVAVTVISVAAERRLVTPALAVSVAAVAGAWRGEPPPTLAPLAWADAATAVRGRVVDNPAATARSQRFLLDVDEVETGEHRLPGRGRVCLWGPALPEVSVDDLVTVGGSVAPIDDVAPQYAAYFRSQGCAATMRAYWLDVEARGSGWRREMAGAARRMTRVIQEAAPGDAGVLLSGLVTGDDHAFSEARRDAFLLTGTTHLTAVSGANVALLVTVAATLGTATGLRRRVVWLATTMAAVWAYALLAGAEPPAVRAALVATAASLAARFGRRADFVTLLVLAAAAMVALDPAQLWRLSFQLSFAASLALAAVLPTVAPDGPKGWLRAAVLAILAAQLATLPILLPLDGRASLVGFPANLLVGPLVDIAFPLAALAAVAGLLWAPLGEVVLLPAWLCAEGILAIVDALAAAPGATRVGAVPIPLALLLTAVASLAILVLSEEGRRWLRRLTFMRQARPVEPHSGMQESETSVEPLADRPPSRQPGVGGSKDAGEPSVLLPPSLPRLLRLGEEPTARLTPDAYDPIDEESPH
ncbi:MAG: ComEC family competence protein [Chloroflexota bacterium]|nr:ComEC family competence protein [Chloroflexota bacterium]